VQQQIKIPFLILSYLPHFLHEVLQSPNAQTPVLEQLRHAADIGKECPPR
jgi:hypothetical protein